MGMSSIVLHPHKRCPRSRGRRCQVYRVAREMLPREWFGPAELLRWLEETQACNERARRSHAKRRATLRTHPHIPTLTVVVILAHLTAGAIFARPANSSLFSNRGGRGRHGIGPSYGSRLVMLRGCGRSISMRASMYMCESSDSTTWTPTSLRVWRETEPVFGSS